MTPDILIIHFEGGPMDYQTLAIHNLEFPHSCRVEQLQAMDYCFKQPDDRHIEPVRRKVFVYVPKSRAGRLGNRHIYVLAECRIHTG